MPNFRSVAALIVKNRIVSAIFAGSALLIAYMAVTGTLAYPYIMLSRQAQMFKSCLPGSSDYAAYDYGFMLSAPAGYCFLPNRLYPADGSVQVLPSGAYSVISEYAKGSIIAASRSTLLFEPDQSDRNPTAVVAALRAGGFLQDGQVTETTNDAGLHVTLAKNVRGLDPTKHFDWAFVSHPNGKVFLSILNSHQDDSAVFDHLVKTLRTAP